MCVAMAMLLPLIAALAPIIHNARTEAQVDSVSRDLIPGKHAYGFILTPPILCIATDVNVTFYVVILPTVLLLLVGIITQVLVTYMEDTQGSYVCMYRNTV